MCRWQGRTHPSQTWHQKKRFRSLSERVFRRAQKQMLLVPELYGICVTEFSYSCWCRFHVVHIAVMWKTYSYQKWNMDFFVLFNQQTQSLFTNTMFFPFMFHLTCICKPAVLPQMISLFWWSLYSDYFDLSTLVSSLPFYKVCWLRVVLFSQTALTHTHRFQTPSWTRWNQGSKNLFSNTRQGGSKRKVLVAKVAV